MELGLLLASSGGNERCLSAPRALAALVVVAALDAIVLMAVMGRTVANATKTWWSYPLLTHTNGYSGRPVSRR